MKNLLIIFMVFATFTLSAQKLDSNQGAKSNHTVAQKIDLKTKQMTLELGLNKSQQEKIKAAMTEISKTMPAKSQKQTVKSSEEKYANKSARMDRKIAFKNKLKDILTPEQMKTWEQKNMAKPHTNTKKKNFKKQAAK